MPLVGFDSHGREGKPAVLPSMGDAVGAHPVENTPCNTAAGAALGQALIPIPVLGAVVGSSVARLATEHAKRILQAEAEAFAARLRAKYDRMVTSLDDELKRQLANLEAEMLRLGELTAAAFDLQGNAQPLLLRSIHLADAYGVRPQLIIRTTEDVDAYIRGV